jgi:hypothetical protein
MLPDIVIYHHVVHYIILAIQCIDRVKPKAGDRTSPIAASLPLFFPPLFLYCARCCLIPKKYGGSVLVHPCRLGYR